MMVAFWLACGKPEAPPPAPTETSSPAPTDTGFDAPTVPDSEPTDDSDDTEPTEETGGTHSEETEPVGPIPWIDLDAGTLSSALVASWSDAASGRSVTQADVARQPGLGSAAGFPVVWTDGVDDRLVGDAPGLLGDAPFTVILAGVVPGDQLNDASVVAFGRLDLPISGAAVTIDDYAVVLHTGGGEAARPTSGTFTPWFDVPTVISVRRTPGGLSSTTTVRVGGAAVVVAGSAVAPAYVDGPLQLGGVDGLGHAAVGLGAVQLFDVALTDEELAAAECALAEPRGITLAGGCP